MRPIESYDLFEPETANDPFEYYSVLRAQAPVYKMRTGQWIISTHALCIEALLGTESFSSKFIQKMVGNLMGDGGALLGPETLVCNDPPSHTHYRKLVNRAFTPNRVKNLGGAIRAISQDLLKGLEQGPGRFDAVAEFAVPLPLTVLADQIGIARSHLAEFKKWSDATIVPISGMETVEELVESLKLVEELKSYLTDRCNERMHEPKDDMLTDLVTAEVGEGRSIGTNEVVSIIQQFLVAGNESTTSLIAATLQLLLQNPDQLDLLRGDRSLLPNAVEEVLRLESPIGGMWRVTSGDVELGGVVIPDGSMVMLRYASANRDEAVFDDAEAFDIRRENAREHLSLGKGIHFCPGAALAREEVQIGVSLLLDRLPGLRLAPGNDFCHHRNVLLRGLKRLDLEFDAS